MIRITRLNAAVAATALATVTALAGAGSASADESAPQIVTDSPSVVSVDRDTDGDVVVTYDNRSERDLLCEFDVLSQDLVDEYYDYHLGGSAASEELLAALDEAEEEGQRGFGDNYIKAGDLGTMTFNDEQAPDPGSDFPLVLTAPEHRTFSPGVFSWCTAVVDGNLYYSYIEIEKAIATEVDGHDDAGSVGGGGAGIFSSLELLFGS